MRTPRSLPVGSRPALPVVPTPAFWIGQTALFAALALPGLWFDTRSIGDVAYHVLSSVLGAVGTTWLRRDLAMAGLPILRVATVRGWALRVVPLTAVCCVVTDGLLALGLQGATFPRSVYALLGWFVPSLVQWCLGLVVWLAVYITAVSLVYAGRAAEEQRELQRLAEDAEGRVARAVMNPHFLFNALNSVQALIASDPERARAMIGRYTDVLHYATITGRHHAVPLQDEVAIARSYLEIEQERFHDRMRITVDMDPAVAQAMVPALMLQTLCENAVHHGIGTSPSGGTVSVQAQRTGRFVEITIRNPVGGEPTARPRKESSGLRNSVERLRLLYGAEAAIVLRRTAPAEFTTNVRFPLNADDALL
ncbi:MAG: sensor histidine kinase [Gemmatimonas sp.]|jgi:signal transduction histidine kinase|uniref:sensor histidine kinase n=1 Tax=Gemmatimonas sp. TaxID=1962908 RepID=UPI00391FBB27|nr:histidine kinase [Gemmatimonadota bacterium]